MSLLDDIASVREHIKAHHSAMPGCYGCSEAYAATDRIRAALQHLEEGARLLAITEDDPSWKGQRDSLWADVDKWRVAEAKRKDETNG